MKKITRRTFMKVMGTTAAAVGLSAAAAPRAAPAALRHPTQLLRQQFLHRPRPKHLPLKLPILSRKTAFTAK